MVRPEIELTEIRAPHMIAPFAAALSGEVTDILPEGVSRGPGRPFPGQRCDGRFVLLYDPEGQSSWRGNFRIVVLARAAMDPDVAADPMLPTVMWDWLDESLAHAEVQEDTRAGTVTRMLSQSFGEIEQATETVDVEIRASWTPRDEHIGRHLTAWTQLMCQCGGLEPATPTHPVVKRDHH